MELLGSLKPEYNFFLIYIYQCPNKSMELLGGSRPPSPPPPPPPNKIIGRPVQPPFPPIRMFVTEHNLVHINYSSLEGEDVPLGKRFQRIVLWLTECRKCRYWGYLLQVLLASEKIVATWTCGLLINRILTSPYYHNGLKTLSELYIQWLLWWLMAACVYLLSPQFIAYLQENSTLAAKWTIYNKQNHVWNSTLISYCFCHKAPKHKRLQRYQAMVATEPHTLSPSSFINGRLLLSPPSILSSAKLDWTLSSANTVAAYDGGASEKSEAYGLSRSSSVWTLYDGWV